MKYRDYLSLFLFFASYPFVVAGSLLSVDTFKNDIFAWIAEDTQAKRDYDYFVNLFGANESAFVSWSGCTLNDAKLIRVVQQLNSPNLSDWVATPSRNLECRSLKRPTKVHADLIAS